MEPVVEKIDDYRFRISRSSDRRMLVEGIVYASDATFKMIREDQALRQVMRTAALPGVVSPALAMPDIHWGYGFPIGGVVATDIDRGGVISPGGVGYDINCGARLIRTNLLKDDLLKYQDKITEALFAAIPCGVGSEGMVRLNIKNEKKVLLEGAGWAIRNGYGVEEDREFIEENGKMEGALIEYVSERAFERGKRQLGTLGSGNHFVEVEVVDKIYDFTKAKIFNLRKEQVVCMIHTGSRGLGYQVCDDYAKKMIKTLSKYNIIIEDKQLASAPVKSDEGKAYIGAMKCAANYAWANRQCITDAVRNAFISVFGLSKKDLGLEVIYDVAHNIAKFEEYDIEGKRHRLCVHRKGATRAFGPGRCELPKAYLQSGQPVIIPGDMGRASYLLVGTKKAEEETFSSTCHGAGRLLSRRQATKKFGREDIVKNFRERGISIRARSERTLAEEYPESYKDVNEIVDIVEGAGISKKVCRLKPLCVIKG